MISRGDGPCPTVLVHAACPKPVTGYLRPCSRGMWRRLVYEDLVAHPEAVPREILTMAITADGFPGADLAARSMLRKMLNMRGIHTNIMLRGDMAHLWVPTLFARGDRDAFDPPSSGQSLAREMPHARLEDHYRCWAHAGGSTSPTLSLTRLRGTCAAHPRRCRSINSPDPALFTISTAYPTPPTPGVAGAL